MPVFDSLKARYEKEAPKRFTIYLESKNAKDIAMIDMEASMIDRELRRITDSIYNIAISDFNESINLFAINDKKYDLNMPFSEEGQIR